MVVVLVVVLVMVVVVVRVMVVNRWALLWAQSPCGEELF